MYTNYPKLADRTGRGYLSLCRQVWVERGRTEWSSDKYLVGSVIIWQRSKRSSDEYSLSIIWQILNGIRDHLTTLKEISDHLANTHGGSGSSDKKWKRSVIIWQKSFVFQVHSRSDYINNSMYKTLSALRYALLYQGGWLVYLEAFEPICSVLSKVENIEEGG